MTAFNAATLAQNRASEPDLSTWLSANAGSGKTKVLTDRVARLLLRGIAPQRILCLTYTKAAASEMQNRLFALLGKWAMMPDADLRVALNAIGEDGATAALPDARRLFARAIEAPGGLKIQTIHSFCGALLRRFPLEAGLSPAFREIDDRAALALRDEVLNRIAEVQAGRQALGDVAELLSEQGIAALLSEVTRHAAAFDGPVPDAALRAALGVPPNLRNLGQVLTDVFLGREGDLRAALLPHLRASSKQTDHKTADALCSMDLDTPNAATLRALEGLLLTGEKAKEPFTAKVGAIPTKDTRAAIGTLGAELDALCLRVEAARGLRLGLAALDRALAMHRFARQFLPAYTAAKAARGALDFDDLIARTAALLTDPAVAQWVLFKLDGGVDHILIDEAQDTSPSQWRVIEYLTQEFTSGAGARDVERTLFVVGDKKQSIYSFQGADLQVFDQMQAQFRARLAQVGLHLNEAALEHSFRSSDAVLRAVDQSFIGDTATGLGGPPHHLAFFDRMPGRVDLWPVLEPAPKAPDGDWFDPVDKLSDEHHTRQLARHIAEELRRLIDAATPLPHRGGARAMTEGDVLILVRQRGTLFHEIIAACKAQGLQMAGADRLRLGGEMAVRDLRALLAFLDLPEDDLSLAAVLRSPLFGWSEDDLFQLAQGRKNAEYLWTRLRDLGPSPTLDILGDLMAQADFLRPHDLVDRILTRHDGRRRLLARLGAEAEEGIDAFLALTLTYEAQDLPSLSGFLAWLDQDDVQIKRQADTGGGLLRVMTVHGAKGLEAPVVILPDTADVTDRERAQVLSVDDVLACTAAKAELPPPLQNAAAAQAALRAQERARLLYVAMTRAESWLIVAGAGKATQTDCWHTLVRDGLALAGSVQHQFPTGLGQRYQHGDWPVAVTDTARTTAPAPLPLPDYLHHPAPMPSPDARPLSPSQLGGSKVLVGDGGDDSFDALTRGHALHLLLEHLPQWPAGTWDTRAADLLAAIQEGAMTDVATLVTEARAVLSAPELAPFFGPDALAEVEITATLGGRKLLGTVDRLLVTDADVRAIDYKSNRIVPATPAEVPEGLLRQMGAYRAALAQVFPSRPVRVGLVWTQAEGRLMWLPDALVDAALSRALLETAAQGA
jgi:ATP-dependent helicase/nuclease subunit A